MRQDFIDEQNRLQAEYQALLNQQVQQAEEEARLAPLIEAVKREDESNWHNWDAMDVISRVGAGALPIAGTVLGGLSTLPIGGVGGAIAGGGLGSIAGTALNSEIAKKDAYDYQQALNALNEARGQGITQTPEEAVDIARQKTGLLENSGNTASNLLFDLLGGAIAGGGIAKLASKAGAGGVGKILGAIAGRPADYGINALQGALLPQTQENPTFEGDYNTEKNGLEASAYGLGAGLGLSALGHAGSDVLNRFANSGLPQIKEGQPRLDLGVEPEQAIQESVEQQQNLNSKIDLSKKSVEPVPISVFDMFEQKTGVPLTEEQKIELFNNPTLMKSLMAESDILNESMPKHFGYTPTERGINAKENLLEFLNPAQYRTGTTKTSDDIAGYLPSYEVPLLETGKVEPAIANQAIAKSKELAIQKTEGARKTKDVETLMAYKPKGTRGLPKTGAFDQNLKQLQKQTKETEQKVEAFRKANPKAEDVQKAQDVETLMAYKAKGTRGLPKTGAFDQNLKQLQRQTKEITKKIETFKKANSKAEDVQKAKDVETLMAYKAKGTRGLPKTGAFDQSLEELQKQTKETEKKIEAFKKANEQKKKGK